MEADLREIAALALAVSAAGALFGGVAGVLRVGGGLLATPAFYFLLRDFGFDGRGLMHLAVGTAAGVVAVTAFRAALAHVRQGTLDGEAAVLAARWSLAALIGGALGGWVVAQLPDRLLGAVWGSGAFVAAIVLAADDFGGGRLRLSTASGAGAALLLGLVGGGGGAGTGVFGASLFRRAGLAEITVAALTAALGAAACLGAAVALALAGPAAPAPFSVGAVSAPGVALGAVAAALAAPQGVRFAARAPAKLMRVLAGLVAAVAALGILAWAVGA